MCFHLVMRSAEVSPWMGQDPAEAPDSVAPVGTRASPAALAQSVVCVLGGSWWGGRLNASDRRFVLGAAGQSQLQIYFVWPLSVLEKLESVTNI